MIVQTTLKRVCFSLQFCRYMNPVWEHWEQASIGGKGDKVDAYMCARQQTNIAYLAAVLLHTQQHFVGTALMRSHCRKPQMMTNPCAFPFLLPVRFALSHLLPLCSSAGGPRPCCAVQHLHRVQSEQAPVRCFSSCPGRKCGQRLFPRLYFEG